MTSIAGNFMVVRHSCDVITRASVQTPHWGGYLTFLQGVKFLHGVESNGVRPESIGKLPRLLPIVYGKKASRRATGGNGGLGRGGKGGGQDEQQSLLGPSNTAQRFLADDQNKLALILSEWQ